MIKELHGVHGVPVSEDAPDSFKDVMTKLLTSWDNGDAEEAFSQQREVIKQGGEKLAEITRSVYNIHHLNLPKSRISMQSRCKLNNKT